MSNNMKCRVCAATYHDCGSCGNPPYMGRGFCDLPCYKKHRKEVSQRVLNKYGVSLEDFTSILDDFWDEGIDADSF